MTHSISFPPSGPALKHEINLSQDLKGFRFEELRKHDDPMFVPGSVKYLDMDGLLSLCAPARLTVIDRAESKIARQVYDASGASAHLSYLPPDQADLKKSILSILK